MCKKYGALDLFVYLLLVIFFGKRNHVDYVIFLPLQPVCIPVVDYQLIAPAPYVAPIWYNGAGIFHKVVQVSLHSKLADVGGRGAETPEKVNPVLITPTGRFVASQGRLSLGL